MRAMCMCVFVCVCVCVCVRVCVYVVYVCECVFFRQVQLHHWWCCQWCANYRNRGSANHYQVSRITYVIL